MLTVGLSATQDVTLKLGSEQQTVQVTANAELINTVSPSIGMTVNENEVTQLPLNGARSRNHWCFLRLGLRMAPPTGSQSIRETSIFRGRRERLRGLERDAPAVRTICSTAHRIQTITSAWLRPSRMPTPHGNFASLPTISMPSMDSLPAQLSYRNQSRVQTGFMAARLSSFATRA